MTKPNGQSNLGTGRLAPQIQLTVLEDQKGHRLSLTSTLLEECGFVENCNVTPSGGVQFYIPPLE